MVTRATDQSRTRTLPEDRPAERNPADLSREEGERRLTAAQEALAQVDGNDVVAEELAIERVQSAQALIEAVDALLTGR